MSEHLDSHLVHMRTSASAADFWMRPRASGEVGVLPWGKPRWEREVMFLYLLFAVRPETDRVRRGPRVVQVQHVPQ